MTVKVAGLRHLSKTLEQLPKDIVGKGASGPVAKSLRKTMKPVKELAQSKTPIGRIRWSEDPGRLKRNLMLVRQKDPGQFGMTEVYTVRPRVKRRSKRDDPNNAWYWHFVEFGTSQQSAQPFLRPAWDSSKNSLLPNFRRELAKDVERIGRKLERQNSGRRR